METGECPSVQVIPGHSLKHVRRTREHGDVVGDRRGEWPGALAVDEDGRQAIPGAKRSFDHDVALGDEIGGHVASRLLANLSQHVIA